MLKEKYVIVYVDSTENEYSNITTLQCNTLEEAKKKLEDFYYTFKDYCRSEGITEFYTDDFNDMSFYLSVEGMLTGAKGFIEVVKFEEEEKEMSDEEYISKLKEYLSDYYEKEFDCNEVKGDNGVYGVAYTTDEKEEHELQVKLNSNNLTLEYFIDNDKKGEYKFTSRKDLLSYAKFMSFDELINDFSWYNYL